jgi:hypothetical protein
MKLRCWKRLAPNRVRGAGLLSTRENSASSSLAKKLKTVDAPPWPLE